MQSTYLDGQNRVDRIDGLRALAVSGVLFIHAQMLTPTPLLAPLAHYGQLGVQLFFFLSGYIIYMAWERGGTGIGRLLLESRRPDRAALLPDAGAQLHLRMVDEPRTSSTPKTSSGTCSSRTDFPAAMPMRASARCGA